MQEESSGSQEESQHDVRAAVVPAGPAPASRVAVPLAITPTPTLWGGFPSYLLGRPSLAFRCQGWG